MESCIGYMPKLSVPKLRWWNKLIGRTNTNDATNSFIQCIVSPIRSLIKGVNAGRAKLDAAKAWQKAAKSFLMKDMHIAAVFEINAQNINVWGNKSAKI